MSKKRETVVITGASAGVGRATAREFAKHGARVALLARGEAGLEAARREVESLGGQAMVLPVDIAYSGQVEAAAEAVEARLGPIDIWINNAMVSVFISCTGEKTDTMALLIQISIGPSLASTASAAASTCPE